ncbi:UNVERIFIED_ORG: NADPH:quinone reductase-like Zn-dependent oxidoreductase [Nocardia globerula]|uniref:NADPH:quinone reductase-like Zn-dependent oxidoreductase n=1 Tax=Nocardia globerula TaxID=1818 RepID=A0A652YIH5_NOCGL|nr:NADP-dependent oxidoreductase [Rhodococcus globerulus]NMD64054.1 NADP-dependent oxidoreductase [Nocardia globerula]PVX66680.1 NADPH:quinone reductase-like Zn-dependent oxidoreductase [Rhodococcus globerulus]
MVLAYGFTEYGGPQTQSFFDVSLPPPGAGQIVVSVRAAGVNPADWKVRAGTRKDTVPVTLPAVLGREVSGVVTSVGPRVTEFDVGDEVFGSTATGFGGYTEATVLNASQAARKPTAASWADAAVIPVACGTAFDALHDLDLAAGATLLVLGAGGGVGTSTLSLARARGITVLGVASAAKQDAVEETGSLWVDSGDLWADAVAALAPSGVDGVFDLVGGEPLQRAASLRRPGAPLISIADSVAATELGGSGVERRRTTAVFTAVAELVADGSLDPAVRQRFPFEQAGSALAAVESGHSAGKVVIEFDHASEADLSEPGD